MWQAHEDLCIQCCIKLLFKSIVAAQFLCESGFPFVKLMFNRLFRNITNKCFLLQYWANEQSIFEGLYVMAKQHTYLWELGQFLLQEWKDFLNFVSYIMLAFAKNAKTNLSVIMKKIHYWCKNQNMAIKDSSESCNKVYDSLHYNFQTNFNGFSDDIVNNIYQIEMILILESFKSLKAGKDKHNYSKFQIMQIFFLSTFLWC